MFVRHGLLVKWLRLAYGVDRHALELAARIESLRHLHSRFLDRVVVK